LRIHSVLWRRLDVAASSVAAKRIHQKVSTVAGPRKKTQLPEAPPAAKPVRAPGLGFVVGILSRRILWAVAKKTSAHGVMPAQYPVLRCLSELQSSTQSELSRLCGIEQPSMAVTLNRMERNGLIERTPDASDGRRKLVTLTALGTKMHKLMKGYSHMVYDQATEGIGDEDIQAFLRICAQMTDNLQRKR
jgi:MarR family transcriptional regulator for hemolysin